MLSFVGGKSTAYTMAETGVVLYADENYAREIMQLFTTGESANMCGTRGDEIVTNDIVVIGEILWHFNSGLVKLNQNGTELYDDNGETSLVYTK